MPAIASLEDLKAAQKEGVSISLCALLYALRKWRRIGWKNTCKLQRTLEQLKGERD